jgi:hypothetical protein
MEDFKMSKMSKVATKMTENQKLRPDEIVTNFMGGDSYVMDPIITLKMVTASSIFGEPAYYRNGEYAGKTIRDGLFDLHEVLEDFGLFSDMCGSTTTEIMESAIDAALDFDFGATLDWAVELRKTYHMRLNPQVIMVRAALHPVRQAFTDANPGTFNKIQQQVMARADEPATQLAYFVFKNEGKKSNLPSILKRSIANKLSGLGRYQVAKYKNHEIGMINAVRLTHANSEVLNELMQKGTVEVTENEKTWENLRSEGKSWEEIFNTITMGHMALLRNLRGVFTEVNDSTFATKYLNTLKAGVPTGQQFPFRYWSAYRAVERANDPVVNHKQMILDTLEECIDIAINNMPKLKGKTMCLSDNSGSAWGTFNSEYGSVTVAEIDNLSSVITAMNSDEGYVGKFGDRLKKFSISQRNGVLTQTQKITDGRGDDVGGSTEGGIWEFFRDAIANKEHWDNIFIYSDMQAGTGGLYGTSKHQKEYAGAYSMDNDWGERFINVFKLVQEYRKIVNPKVNVFSVQTAGYNNMVIPQMAYRTHLMYGWTGKETIYAQTMIDLWDEVSK